VEATASQQSSPYIVDDHTLDVFFRQARSANTFSDEPVSVDEVLAAFELAKFAPTQMNIHPLRLLLVRPGEARDRLVACMNEGNRIKTASAPLVAVVAADIDFHDLIPAHFPHFPQGREIFAPDEAARAHTARYNTALETGFFILAVRATGLYAGPMGGFDAAAIDAEFFSGTSWRTQLVIAIGHPGENAWFPRLPRISADEAVRVI
jgi:3-hydroxypropanoate dehydrogenase